ncbi:PaaI family thioesterase [Nocardioides terrisoli]|uniref:PaaI family thioesterase n=1 Tax=Nocardioides terrisoli TaxID=3388267 RepID=UPI00287B7CDC|nr:PaaI family thioesterase [Nocardioides marmorisolisilvae]
MTAPFRYDVVEMSTEEIEAEREVFGGLAQSIRELAEASLRTTIDPEAADQVRHEIEALTERLRAAQIPGSFGVQLTSGGTVRGHGNAVVGLRNPVAVPLEIERTGDGRARSEFVLNALYEGPPTMVHGGVIALVLDQVFGEAAADGGTPGMTGTLTLRYRKNTPLGKCSAEAWIDRREGVKTFVRGVMRDADGETTVEAEGVFILPRWAREALQRHESAPPRFE